MLRNQGFKIQILICVLFLVFACNNTKNSQFSGIKDGKKVTLKYAKGFSITKFKNYSILEIKNPWPNSYKTFKYNLSSKKIGNSKNDASQNNNNIHIPIERVVVTSTTHIPFLELLNVEQTLVGFPGLDYISSERTRYLIEDGTIRDLGMNQNLNIEVLLQLKPEVLIGFGVEGTNKSLETIKKSGIPVIYNGDWVESSPLAKAEWIKFFGVLFNKEQQADSIFNRIEKNYKEAKQIAGNTTKIPTVLSGAMYKDIWYLPSGTSPEGQFLKDANVNYLWKDSDKKGSLALNFELVFEKAKTAEIWINPSYYSSFEDLKKANIHYSKFDAFKNKNIYSVSNTQGETGGILYYELGIARPDIVLKDLIKICHPQLLLDYNPYFFKPLK